jgi:hypothetical protein
MRISQLIFILIFFTFIFCQKKENLFSKFKPTNEIIKSTFKIEKSTTKNGINICFRSYWGGIINKEFIPDFNYKGILYTENNQIVFKNERMNFFLPSKINQKIEIPFVNENHKIDTLFVILVSKSYSNIFKDTIFNIEVSISKNDFYSLDMAGKNFSFYFGKKIGVINYYIWIPEMPHDNNNCKRTILFIADPDLYLVSDSVCFDIYGKERKMNMKNYY